MRHMAMNHKLPIMKLLQLNQSQYQLSWEFYSVGIVVKMIALKISCE